MCTKKRALNFSAKEEMVLVSLAKKFKLVLECKLTDTKTHREKADCWLKIEQEFNSVSGEVYRPAEVLRKKYDNIKKRVKKKYADEKCYVMGTGGGGPPPADITFTEVDKEIKEVLGTRIDGKPSEFDDDAEMTLEVYDFNDEETQIIEEPVIVEHDYAASDVLNCTPSTSKVNNDKTELNDWTNYTPDMLRSKKSRALSINTPIGKRKYKESSATEKVSQWAELKSQLELSKAAFLKEEFDLKLQHMRERHEQEMRRGDLETQWLQREHEIKLEILEMEKQLLKSKFKK